MGQKFTYTEVDCAFLNGLENYVMAFETSDRQLVLFKPIGGAPVASLLDIMGKSKEMTSEKKLWNSTIWLILGSSFQMPKGSTFVCTNDSTQV